LHNLEKEALDFALRWRFGEFVSLLGLKREEGHHGGEAISWRFNVPSALAVILLFEDEGAFADGLPLLHDLIHCGLDATVQDCCHVANYMSTCHLVLALVKFKVALVDLALEDLSSRVHRNLALQECHCELLVFVARVVLMAGVVFSFLHLELELI
jgi:hypothetical protein